MSLTLYDSNTVTIDTLGLIATMVLFVLVFWWRSWSNSRKYSFYFLVAATHWRPQKCWLQESGVVTELLYITEGYQLVMGKLTQCKICNRNLVAVQCPSLITVGNKLPIIRFIRRKLLASTVLKRFWLCRSAELPPACRRWCEGGEGSGHPPRDTSAQLAQTRDSSGQTHNYQSSVRLSCWSWVFTCRSAGLYSAGRCCSGFTCCLCVKKYLNNNVVFSD